MRLRRSYNENAQRRRKPCTNPLPSYLEWPGSERNFGNFIKGGCGSLFCFLSTANMYPLTSVFLFILPLVSRSLVLASDPSSTVVRLFIADNPDASTYVATGYVAAADATATTYVLDCYNDRCANKTALTAPMATVTVGPSTQHISLSAQVSGATVYRDCSFHGPSQATCQWTSVAVVNGTQTSSMPITNTYIPTEPTDSSDESVTQFPGYFPVLITSGAEKLKAAKQSANAAQPTGIGAAQLGSGILALAGVALVAL